MQPRIVAALAIVVCAVLAAGCSAGGAGSRPSASRIVAGSCIAGTPPTYGQEGDVHPTDALVVDCHEPHVYEVSDVLPIPTGRLPGHRATAGNYAYVSGVLGEEDDELFNGFYPWAYQECHHAELQALGLGHASFDGRADGSLEVASQHFSSTLDLIDKRHWVAHPSLVCLERFAEESEDPWNSPVTPVRGALTPQFTRSSFPERLRTCYDYSDQEGLVGVDCQTPHVYEPVVTFDARAYLSATQIERERHRRLARGLSGDASQRTDRVCGTLLASVGLRWDVRHASPYTDRYVAWTDDQPYLSVECGLVPVTRGDLMFPGGSVVGSSIRPLRLVHRGSGPTA